MSLMKFCAKSTHMLFKLSAQKLAPKGTLRQRKLYDVYKQNQKMAQKNVHRPNAIKSTYTFRPKTQEKFRAS